MSQTEVQNFLHQEKQITRKIPSASVLKYLEICREKVYKEAILVK